MGAKTHDNGDKDAILPEFIAKDQFCLLIKCHFITSTSDNEQILIDRVFVERRKAFTRVWYESHDRAAAPKSAALEIYFPFPDSQRGVIP